MWYQLMSHVLYNVTTQQKGMVFVMMGSPTRAVHRIVPHMHLLLQGLPYREVANHICIIKQQQQQQQQKSSSTLSLLNPMLRFLLVTCGSTFRLRCRIHVEGT